MDTKKCPNCQNEVNIDDIKCSNCGYMLPVNVTNTNNENILNLHVKHDKSKQLKSLSTKIKLAGIALTVLASCFLGRGFYVKNVYENSEYSFVDTKNAYVGGDAYNYIINGTYFSGFMALSGMLYVCATGLICTSFILESKINYKNEEELPNI